MEKYIEEAVNAMDEEDLLESYDKELALKQESFKEGKEEGIEQIAKNLLRENVAIEIIMKVTGLSKETIEELNVD